MPLIRRLVLDVLVPHQPNIVDLARKLASQGDYEVRITVVEMDDKTETLVVVIEGADVDFDVVKAAITDFGGSLHSIDEVEAHPAKESDERRWDKG
jgi:hypothetical protein